MAQNIFIGFYLITAALVMLIYKETRAAPPWSLILLCISLRLHIIFVLRLFNDGIAMLLFYLALFLLCKQCQTLGCLVFSAAVSIKMNVLLFAPGLGIVLLKAVGWKGTLFQIMNCAILQLVLGAPFLQTNAVGYLSKSFELSRVFMFKWSVNFKFLPEDIFLSKPLAMGLLAGHLVVLLAFAHKRW